MAAKVITFGIQKGGCGKSTTTCLTAYLMNQQGYRVLVVDMDSQGNSTELLTDTECNEFIDRSVLEAMYVRNTDGLIVEVNELLHVLPANNLLATLPRFLYTGQTLENEKYARPKLTSSVLSETLESVRDKYDYILIDTPPSLGEHTANALYASDFVVVMYECSRWCYSAIPNFFETLEFAVACGNDKLQIAGILRTLNDARRTDMKMYSELIKQDYPDLVFDTTITRSAAIGRISMRGFEENPELKAALGPHLEFYKELMNCVGEQTRAAVKK